MSNKTTLTISSLTSTGVGVGTLPDGMKVFVVGALPGEDVEIKIDAKKKKHAEASLVNIVTSSAKRMAPSCPQFGACGGCQIMHLAYSEQLNIKRQKVVDAFNKIGKIESPEILPCVPSPSSLHYRNKIQLPLIWNGEKKLLGLYRNNTHEIIPIDACPIQCHQGNEILRFIQKELLISSVRYLLIRTTCHQNEALVIFVTDGRSRDKLKAFACKLLEHIPTIKGAVANINKRSDNVILTDHYIPLSGRPFIFETILGKIFKISPGAFFQVNTKLAELLYQKALTLAALTSNEIFVDAFCGVGTLTLLAADHALKVYGIECVSSAISDANENAQLNGIKNHEFLCGKAEELLEKIPTCDVVLLNPPRKGCDPKLLHTLLKKRPKRVIYISCDPATCARDLLFLSSHYKVDYVEPFDMFPQTMHVETLVRLQKI